MKTDTSAKANHRLHAASRASALHPSRGVFRDMHPGNKIAQSATPCSLRDQPILRARPDLAKQSTQRFISEGRVTRRMSSQSVVAAAVLIFSSSSQSSTWSQKAGSNSSRVEKRLGKRNITASKRQTNTTRYF